MGESRSLKSVEVPDEGLTDRTLPATDDVSVMGVESQHGLSAGASVEARLAEVVHRLCSLWFAGPAAVWSDIHPISEVACIDLEKRIAVALKGGFFHFSQFLCGLEMLLLKSKHGGLELEQSILGIEKLVVDLADCRRELVEISNVFSGHCNVSSGSQGGRDD